jgi:CO/xanthine dehydrogenase FAD-binding subunit
MYLPKFEYFEPRTLDEACSLLDKHRGKAKVFAGGTDLIVQIKLKALSPEYLINLKQIPGLTEIKHSESEGLRIGALTTHRSIYTSAIIKENYDLLGSACRRVGHVQVQNIGTIGGNICNGSPSADTIPSLMALGANLKLMSVNGERIVPIEKFFTTPFETVCKSNEILTEIQIPKLLELSRGVCLRMGKITENEALVIVSVLVTVRPEDKICIDARIGLGSVSPTPMRARKGEELLKNKKMDDQLIQEVAQKVVEETSPRSRPELRREVTKVYVERALRELMNQLNTN